MFPSRVGVLVACVTLASCAVLGRLACQADTRSYLHGPVSVTTPSSTVTGGDTIALTVDVTSAVATDTTFTIATDSPGAFSSLPSSVVMTQGTSSVTFYATTATVSTSVNATVAAGATGYQTGTCGVTITP